MASETTVTTLATHLLSLLQPPADAISPTEPQHDSPVRQVDAARLAFYHFLKNLCEPGEILTTAILDRFFRRSLQYAHWEENKLALFTEINACLQHFSNQFNEPLPLPPFSSPFEVQVIKAESFRSLERVIEDWIQTQQGPSEQIKMIRDREEKLLVCRLQLDRSLVVHIFDRHLCLRDGRVEPLTDDMVLYYTPDLTIDSIRVSQIETAPHTVARFRMLDEPAGLTGVSVRGYTFQKVMAFDGGDIHRYPTLFYPMKRVEQFFINRTTDPLYVELTGFLEKASDLLAQRHPEAVRFAEVAMERGRLAFDQVFVDDRLLRLLLENLERALKLEHQTAHQTVQQTHTSESILEPSIGLRLKPEEVFFEPDGPDLVELQEAELCETIVPANRPTEL